MTTMSNDKVYILKDIGPQYPIAGIYSTLENAMRYENWIALQAPTVVIATLDSAIPTALQGVTTWEAGFPMVAPGVQVLPSRRACFVAKLPKTTPEFYHFYRSLHRPWNNRLQINIHADEAEQAREKAHEWFVEYARLFHKIFSIQLDDRWWPSVREG